MESQGYKTYASVSYGLVAPAGIPAEVVDVLAQALEKSVASQEYKDKLSSGNMFPKYLGPADFDKYIDQVSDWTRPLVQAAKQQ